MNPDRPDITVVTDISANIFAVFILILIILLAARQQAPGSQPALPSQIDIQSDLVSVDRSPLSPAAMVDLLYDRRNASPTIKIDAFDDRIDFVQNGSTRQVPLSSVPGARPQALPTLPPSATVGLYVFSHRGYRFITEALAAANRPWREISVPAALRRFDPATGVARWSAGFTELAARPLDENAFRIELARLLASPGPDPGSQSAARASGGTAGVSAAAPSIQSAALPERLARWWREFLNVAAIVGGIVLVLVTERASPRAGHRAG
jgi:hypothetical protein